MFQVQFVVDDKKFGDVMAGLSGKVMNLEWRHLANTKVLNGAVVAEHPVGTIREAILPTLVKAHPQIAKGAKINTDMIAAAIEQLGGKPSYRSGAKQYLLDSKLIKKVGYDAYVMVRR